MLCCSSFNHLIISSLLPSFHLSFPTIEHEMKVKEEKKVEEEVEKEVEKEVERKEGRGTRRRSCRDIIILLLLLFIHVYFFFFFLLYSLYILFSFLLSTLNWLEITSI